VVPLLVTSAAGNVTYNVRLTRNAPALFVSPDTGQALVFDANFQPLDTIKPRDTVILYATGLGPTDSSGRVVDPVKVYIGDQKAQVLYAGLAPGLQGIYQLNALVAPLATDRIYVRSGGWQSNFVHIGIPSGTNTANVQGTIDGLYPSSDPGYSTTPQRPCVGDNDPGPCGPTNVFDSLSIMLHAGVFTVSFDIVPGAGPFSVAAVGDAGGSIISIDPAAGTYTASVTTLAPAERAGDFSSTIMPLWDYSSCDWKSAMCQPFPANIVPVGRIDPYWARATGMLPVPNTTASASPNVVLQASGSLSASRLAVDAQSNSSLSMFGGIIQVPYGPFVAGVSTFSLYVDGRLIASKGFALFAISASACKLRSWQFLLSICLSRRARDLHDLGQSGAFRALHYRDYFGLLVGAVRLRFRCWLPTAPAPLRRLAGLRPAFGCTASGLPAFSESIVLIEFSLPADAIRACARTIDSVHGRIALLFGWGFEETPGSPWNICASRLARLGADC